jgi:ketosteroid isomerase-like protein
MTTNPSASRSVASAFGIAFLSSATSIGLTLLIIGAITVSPAGPEPTPLDPASEIKAMLDQQEKDWNAGNLDAFLTGYWDSPKVVFQSGGDRNVGFEAMRDRYRKRYQAEGRSMGRVTFSEVEIEPLAADAAFVRGRWGLIMPDGKTPGGLFTLIVRKLPGAGWKIVHDHTSSAEAPATAPAPAASTAKPQE